MKTFFTSHKTKRNNLKHYFRWPKFGIKHSLALQSILNNDQINDLNIIREFEYKFKLLTKRKFALAHCNGTSAIFNALKAFELKPGDEVIVPSATHWASVLPVLHCSAIPVFADSEPETLGLCPNDVEAKITDKTKAIVITHLWGMPAKLDELLAIAKKHNLKILEDASHAHGASYKGKPIGSFGDASVFSCQASKLCPTGEGGMLLTDNQDIYEKSVLLGHYTRIPELRKELWKYAATGFGYQFQISTISAKIGSMMLDDLEKNNLEREKSINYLSNELEKLGFETFRAPIGIKRVYYEFYIQIPKKPVMNQQEWLQALIQNNVIVSPVRYSPLHLQPVFTDGSWHDLVSDKEFIDTKKYQTLYSSCHLSQIENYFSNLLQIPICTKFNPQLLSSIITGFSQTILKHKPQQNKHSNVNFALIGASGYIAEIHMSCIKALGCNLVAVLDTSDANLQRMDKWDLNTKFFSNEEKFSSYIKKLNTVKFISICTPDYLHKHFCELALKLNCNALCEKPLVTTPHDLSELEKLETNEAKIFTVSQIRYLDNIESLKKELQTGNNHQITIDYVTPRGEWYFNSWRGDKTKAGGFIMDIGIHFMDLLIVLLGEPLSFQILEAKQRSARGTFKFKNAAVTWFLSIDKKDLPDFALARGYKEWRNIMIDNKPLNISTEFRNLHIEVYKKLIENNGLRIQEIKPTLDLVYNIQKELESCTQNPSSE